MKIEKFIAIGNRFYAETYENLFDIELNGDDKKLIPGENRRKFFRTIKPHLWVDWNSSVGGSHLTCGSNYMKVVDVENAKYCISNNEPSAIDIIFLQNISSIEEFSQKYGVKILSIDVKIYASEGHEII